MYRKRNMITVLVMHILLASFLVGCENKSSMWFYKTSETAYYVNKDGKRVSRIYYLEYEEPDYAFDRRGFSKIEKSIRITSPFDSDRFVGDEVYFIDNTPQWQIDNFNFVQAYYAKKYVVSTTNSFEVIKDRLKTNPFSWDNKKLSIYG